MTTYRTYSAIDAADGETTSAGHTKHNTRFSDIQSWFPVTTSASQYQALLLNSGKTGFTFNHVLRSDAALENDAGAGTSGQVLQSDGDGTVSWASTTPLTDGDKGDITVSGGGLTWSLDAGVVDTAELATDAVTTAKILDANVTTAKIADSNVTTAKINDAAVTLAKMANLSSDKIIGRESSTGVPEAISVGAASGTPGGLILSSLAGGNTYLRPSGIRTGMLCYSDDSLGSQNKITNSTTETSIIAGTQVGFADEASSLPTITASTLITGSAFEFKAIGEFTTTGTPTMQFKFGIDEIGAGPYVAFADTGAITVPVSGMSGLIEIYGIFQITTAGAAAEGIGNGYISLTNGSTRINYKLATPNDTTVTGLDTTVNGDLAATFQWGTASASNTVHFTNVSIMRLR